MNQPLKRKPIKKEKVQRKQNLIYRVRKQIVEMRYGEVGLLGDLKHTVPQISKATNVPRSTVNKVLERYRKLGGILFLHPKKGTRVYTQSLTPEE